MSFQISRAGTNLHQFAGDFCINTTFMSHDFDFDPGLGIIKIDPAKTLLGGLFQILHQRLVARVVGNDDLKIFVCLDQLTFLLQWQLASMIGQRVNNHRRILARLDNFIEVADGPDTRSNCQRAILPAGTVNIEQVTPHQVRGGHILGAGDAD